VVLRDGRKLYGILRSYDQFGNIVLGNTIERYYVDLEYSEEHLGIFLVRGENIVLLGEIDEDEFKSVSRRMSRFKRPLEQFMPQYREVRRVEGQAKLLAQQFGATDMAEYDAY
jgi:U6 snRNA-associated Sm-like protein LSm1